MPNSALVLEVDLTGKAAANLIQGEQHSIGTGVNRLIAPKHGAFYKEGLVVKDGSSFLPIDDSKYLLLDFDSKASMLTGKEVYGSIVVTDASVFADVAIDYQAFGGEFSRNRSALTALLATRMNAGGTMDWEQVTDKLDKYPPAQHKMLLAHIYGLEYVVAGLDRLTSAAAVGSSPVYERTVANVERLLSGLSATGHAKATEVMNTTITGFKQTLDASAFGLDLLNNFETMPKPIAEGAANIGFLYQTGDPDFYSTIHSLDSFSRKAQTEMVNANETSIGIASGKYMESTRGSVLALPNGATFLLQSKKYHNDAGITYDPSVYPEGTLQTDEFCITRINNAQTNAGGVFMLFNRNSHATYIGTLRSDSCSSKLIWRKMFHDGELTELTDLLQKHAVDTKNPHELTAADVGFDKLENLPVVTTDEIDKQVGVRKYLTTDTLQYYMKLYMTNVKPPPSPNPTPDPNAPTMDQAQIVFTQCRVPPPDPVYPPKDQFIKSFCDGTDKFGTFTDGAGSTYDKIIELNSDDCKHKSFPAVDTLIVKYCEGATQYGKFADGIGGTIDRKIMEQSPECGAMPTKSGVVSEGTLLGSFCKEQDKYTRYADGKGGSYDLLSEKFSKDCAGDAGATIVFSKTSEITLGGTDTTTATLTGFTPNQTYSMEIYVQTTGLNGGQPLKTTTVEVAIDKSGNGSWSNSATDTGIIPRGASTNWAYVPVIGLKSNVVTATYKPGTTTPSPTPAPAPAPAPTGSPPPSSSRRILLTRPATISVGEQDRITAVFSGYTPNSTISAEYWTQSPDFNSGQPYKTETYVINIDATGTGNYSYNSIYNPSQAPISTYTSWVIDTINNVRSNVTTTQYKGNSGGGPTISFTKSESMSIGETDQTSAFLTGFTPNSQVSMDIYMQLSSFNGGNPYKTTTVTVNINSAGSGQWVNVTTDNGIVPRGTTANWAQIPSMGLKSNVITAVYKPGSVAPPPSLPTPSPRVDITLNGNGNSPTLKVHDVIKIIVTFAGFPGAAYDPRNTTTRYYLNIGANDPRNVGPFEINLSGGSGSATFDSTLLENDRIRGLVTYRIRAEWYTAEGELNSAYSNTVSANWVSP